jgi:hypothetical protein
MIRNGLFAENHDDQNGLPSRQQEVRRLMNTVVGTSWKTYDQEGMRQLFKAPTVQDVQNGLPARPQGVGRLRRTLAVRRKETYDRERRWRPFSTSG